VSSSGFPAASDRSATAPDATEGAGAPPVDAAEFAALMHPFEPFEPAPRIAVAVSGGPDSLALTILLDAWARTRGGAILGLTVDHGLRAESADEARWVGEVLGARGIEHAILRWQGPKPEKVRQQQAREERYARLREYCAGAGVLHLAIAHQREDRAETVLLRVRGGSGLDGLAGIAHQREMPELRLIRPLLNTPRARLKATLRTHGLSWVSDPTNRNPDHLRVRLRRLRPALDAGGLTVANVNAFAGLIGRARQRLEAAQNALLARAVMLHPAGFARLDPAAFATAPPPVARGALTRVLLAVGGLVYPPRSERLDRFEACLRDGLGRGRTLGGCRIVPRGDAWLVVREAGRAPRFAVQPGERLVYDGRFELALAADAPKELAIGTLGEAGWAEVTAAAPELRAHPLPPPARTALVGLFDGAGVREVPDMGWRREGRRSLLSAWQFAPRRALTGGGFTVAE